MAAAKSIGGIEESMKMAKDMYQCSINNEMAVIKNKQRYLAMTKAKTAKISMAMAQWRNESGSVASLKWRSEESSVINRENGGVGAASKRRISGAALGGESVMAAAAIWLNGMAAENNHIKRNGGGISA
jgi:hypothetical protein